MRYLPLLLLVACAAPSSVRAPLVEAGRVVEARALPPDPSTEVLPEGTTPGDWIEPMAEGLRAPKDGLLVSEERAARDILYRSRYRELRTLYEADRQVWVAHRALYEGQLVRLNDEVDSLQPNWWDRHGTAMSALGGIVLGSGLTIAVIYALVPAAQGVQK